MRIVFHPQARQRMSERGVTEDEVRETVGSDFVFEAPHGRRKHRKSYTLERYWLSKGRRSRMLDVYSVEEGDAVVVLTVVAKDF